MQGRVRLIPCEKPKGDFEGTTSICFSGNTTDLVGLPEFADAMSELNHPLHLSKEPKRFLRHSDLIVWPNVDAYDPEISFDQATLVDKFDNLFPRLKRIVGVAMDELMDEAPDFHHNPPQEPYLDKAFGDAADILKAIAQFGPTRYSSLSVLHSNKSYIEGTVGKNELMSFQHVLNDLDGTGNYDTYHDGSIVLLHAPGQIFTPRDAG